MKEYELLRPKVSLAVARLREQLGSVGALLLFYWATSSNNIFKNNVWPSATIKNQSNKFQKKPKYCVFTSDLNASGRLMINSEYLHCK